MIDEFAIQQVINLYTIDATRGDYDKMLKAFLPDAFWGCPELGTEWQGHDDIHKAMLAFSSQFEHCIQSNSPAAIYVEGDTATARSVMRECWKYAGKHEALEVHGIYEDNLTRTAEGWRFARRSFVHAHFLRFAVLPGALRG